MKIAKPRLQWVAIDPQVGSSGDFDIFRGRVRELSGVPAFDDLPARLDAVQQIRSHYEGTRGKSAPATLRAAILVMCDFVDQGWSIRVRGDQIKMARPAESGSGRDRTRLQLQVQRERYLRSAPVQEFVKTMEKRREYRGKFVSIFSLMRDGAELAQSLSEVIRQKRRIRTVINPYIQVVDAGQQCEHTGLNLADIWRYFRCTWANRYQSVPGRSLMILIRDAAVKNHPVIGISALGSSAVQISMRDDKIGWAADKCVNELRVEATDQDVAWLLELIENGLSNLYTDDLFDRSVSELDIRQLSRPTIETIAWLKTFAKQEREKHFRLVNAAEDHKSENGPRLDGGYWRQQAESPLFRSKRAELLAMFLRAKLALTRSRQPVTGDELRSLLTNPEARQGVQSLILRAKAERVGVAVADVTICGAIAPYSVILGGKLVAMLTASPEVIAAYRDRYASYESVIASSLAGRAVVRAPHLVFLGTTSLYDTEPTQYTRLHVPCESLGGRRGETLRYSLFGSTRGFGTFQFSDETVEALQTVMSQSNRGQRVNSIFGEGTSPRMRKIRQGLDLLNLPSDSLLQHGSARLVYGVALVRNLKPFLLGKDQEPDYLIPASDLKRTTDLISEWWFERWLHSRIRREEVLEKVAGETLTYPVRHCARVVLPTDQYELPIEDLEFNIAGLFH